MKSSKKILLISGSALVGAPQNIMKALNSFSDYDASLIVEEDYAGARNGFFTADAIVLSDDNLELIKYKISNADIIQIHNKISSKLEGLILENTTTENFIYQVHSPLRESPLYSDLTQDMRIKFKVKAACAQYHGYIYPDYINLPLIVNYSPSIREYDGGKINVLFCPSHAGIKGKWNRKSSTEFNEIVNDFSRLPGVNVIRPTKPVRPQELFEIRKTCHISIDEILTGTFHTISLEGLCAGNVVINNSDFFTNRILQNSAGAETPPPFYRSNESNLFDNLVDLYRNPDLLVKIQRDSYMYFINYLRPKALIKKYIDIYNELLVNESVVEFIHAS
ncbi:hypothetical protein NRZ30_20020 [Aeromonas jandaei]|uniref:hypothetical protein n=1 Tax=Aeromonas jandaei TaxID=650 RepID=UPI00227CC5C6|nr:hypothetical protein [Aeromonas jandaei]WAG07289.1 hypothetical protein NRZ30_20020 [Aeromonas jandaei]